MGSPYRYTHMGQEIREIYAYGFEQLHVATENIENGKI